MIGAFRDTLRRAMQAPGGRTGISVLAAMAAAALVGPLLLPDPAAIEDLLAGPMTPSTSHLLGTDALGRDLLSRLVSGARVSLAVALLAVLLSITIGAATGLLAGYIGGRTDALIMRLVDGALAIPRLFALLLLLLVWERIPPWALVVAIGGTGWFATSRLVRGEVLRLRQEAFLQASRALGAGPGFVIRRHLLPNLAGPLVVVATLGVGDVILLEAGLSFLGVGIQPPAPSWGGMILEARPVLLTAWWTGTFPGLAIVATVLSVNLVGEALQSALDPRTA